MKNKTPLHAALRRGFTPMERTVPRRIPGAATLTLLLATAGLMMPGLRAHAALPKVGITGVSGGAHWMWVEAENFSAINGGFATYAYDPTGVTSGMFDPNPSSYANVVFQAWPWDSPPPWIEWNIHTPAAMAAPTILLNYSYAGSSTPGGSVQIDGSSVGTYNAGTNWVGSSTLSAITGGDHTLRLQQNFVYSEPYLDGFLLYDGNLTAAGHPTPTWILDVNPTWMQANMTNLGPVIAGSVTPQFSVTDALGTNFFATKDGVTSAFTPGTTLSDPGQYRVWAVANGAAGPQERIMSGVDFTIVPEPTTLSLLLVGVGSGLLFLGRRRRE